MKSQIRRRALPLALATSVSALVAVGIAARLGPSLVCGGEAAGQKGTGRDRRGDSGAAAEARPQGSPCPRSPS